MISVIQISGHLQFEGKSHFRPHEMVCNKYCSFNFKLSLNAFDGLMALTQCKIIARTD